MPITALPTPPSRSDTVNFASRGDSFLGALPTFVTEANALETNVNNKEASATTSANTATTKAGEALTSANNAATSKTGADTARDAAVVARTAAEAALDSFDDRYLGPKATAPTLDNDGNTLLVGALYWNTPLSLLYVWTGSAWLNTPGDAAFLSFLQSGTGAVARTGQGKLRDIVDVKDFGAVGDGITNDQPAIQAAINYCRQQGLTLYVGPGDYLLTGVVSSDTRLNGLLVRFTADDIDGGGTPVRMKMVCTPETRFLAGSNDMVIFRWSDSWGKLEGRPICHANGKTNVYGFGLIPESLTQTSTVVFQCYNDIDVRTENCAEGFVMQQGPAVAGRESGCWYNMITHHGVNNTRHRWLKESALGAGAATTRNTFHGREGQGGNTGVQYDSGAENYDYIHTEGILSGVSPNTTPTARRIRSAPPTQGGTNEDNYFFGLVEASTRWYDNAAQNTHIVGNPLDESKCLFTSRPLHIEARIVGGTQRIEIAEIVSTQRLINHGPINLLTAGAAGRASIIDQTSGLSDNYNGVVIASNTAQGGAQGNSALPSNELHVGSLDSASYPVTRARVSAFHRNAGGVKAVSGGIGKDGIFLMDPGANNPVAVPGFAFIYVDTVDGDLKVVFGDGVVKTIVTDT